MSGAIAAAALTTVGLCAQPTLGPLTITATRSEDIQRVDDVIERMQRRYDLRTADVTADTLVPGRVHQRLVQYHQGVRVKGGDMRVQTQLGASITVFGRVHPDITVDTRPTLRPEGALSIALAAGLGIPSTTRPTLAIVYAPAARDRRHAAVSPYALVYDVLTFDTRGPVAGGPVLREVDAHTGIVVSTRSRLRAQDTVFQCSDCAVGQGRGVKGDLKKLSVRRTGGGFVAKDGLRQTAISTYDLKGDWRRALDILNAVTPLVDADLASDTDNNWTDSASIDAHTGTGWTLDYLYHRFGRGGLDGKNSPVTVLVHPIRRSDFFTVSDEISSLFHLNAFYCQDCGLRDVLLFGEGLPPGERLAPLEQVVDFFASALDIVAHEMGHAVSDYTSQFVYQGESGALNEAFSDLLGLGIEFFVAETGRHTVEPADYTIGEDVLIPGGIRSISDPRSMGDPDHYSLRFRGSVDNGGVHTNSTIVTHVYYLTIEGGINVTSGARVQGLGVSQRALVEQIFYRALTMLLPTDATFSMARDATLQSARDLSDDRAVEQTIATAWSAVGIE